MSRGPDFAHDLTRSEQRTLDLLRRVASAGQPADATARHVPGPVAERDVVSQLGRRTPATGWRGRLAVAVSAAAVAAIALASGLVPVRPGPTPATVPAATSDSFSTVDVLRQLAAAALRAGPPVSASQTSVVAVAVRKNDVCAENAYQVTTMMKRAAGWPAVAVTIDRVAIPDRTASWLGCAAAPVADPTPHRHVDDTAAGPDGRDGWAKLVAHLHLLLPDLLDPRAIPDGLVVDSMSADAGALAAALNKVGSLPPAGATGWWTAVTQLLSSPLCRPAVRSTALSLAAGRSADVRVVSDHPTDILGRPGITLRVPYSVEGVALDADLTFDQATGALLQRTTYGAPAMVWSTVITAYR